MKSIAIITARGGSKRIPRKNIKFFCGKPIIAYSIEAALKSGCFEAVMVSTDDEEIAEISRSYGAEIPFFRSPETSNDYATTADVINEVLDRYHVVCRDFDAFCCIYPTAPFVASTLLQEAMNELTIDDVDTVMPVVRFSFPPQRALCISDDFISFKYPENAISRSQDLEPLYHDCGQFYFYKVGEDLSFIEEYETASWQEVSRQMVLRNIDMDAVYSAYLDSLRWFKELLTV